MTRRKLPRPRPDASPQYREGMSAWAIAGIVAVLCVGAVVVFRLAAEIF